ncbi:hypothetical protein [uncultured Roseovarius sp.]|uniref:hypothetical protein n=1 Tax=uncultured Roseovarius sp. TaxID=293344 RepID=UPI002607B438|nr:hypothetical protein [uncultured Roseovarius sp.]
MIKLFGSKQAQQDLHAPELEKRYTRFAHTHTRAPVQPVAHTAQHPCQSAPARPKRPAPSAPQEPAQPASLADQLHSEGQISVSLLRHALPSRFAEMDAQTRELAKSNRAELLSPPR